MLARIERDNDLRTIERALTLLTDAAGGIDRGIHRMTWLTRAAVERRSVTILLAVGLFIFGVIAWSSLKQELLPDVSFPVATVIAPFPAAGADDVADQVVAPIERAVLSVSGIDQVNSTSANSIGFITAQFEYGIDVDEASDRDGGGHRRAHPSGGGRPDRLGAEHQRLAGRHRRDQLRRRPR